MIKSVWMTMSLFAATFLLSGCFLDSDSSGSSNNYTGVWALYSGSQVQGSPYWYVHFQDDGTFFISNNLDGTGVRVTGTYQVSGGELIGPFTNPGVGTGRVEAKREGDLLRLDFIEYWHTPHKVVPYTGVRP